MRRLTPFLSSAEGEAAFALRCSRDADGRALIEGEVEAELWVSCQRCLGQLRIPVRQAFRLAVAHGLDEAERLPVELDPLLVESGQCELLELLEDELLLALPQVPMHEPGECGAEQAPAAQQPEVDKDNPFAVLAALKDEQSRT